MDEKKIQELKSLPIAEQAAAWCLEFDQGEPSSRNRRAFIAWIKQSPTHIEEFLQVCALHLMLVESPQKIATIEELKSMATEASGNVVGLDTSTTEQIHAAGTRARPRRQWLVAAAAAVACVAILLVLLGPSESPVQNYRTALGDQRSIVLADDSMVVLNTNSSITIEYTETGRHATLHRGEALFDVTKDPSRPFTVDADNLAIRVLGTKFNVYRQKDQTVVTVVEGKVHVNPVGDKGASTPVPITSINDGSTSNHREVSPRAAAPLNLVAGEQVAVADTGMVAREVEANLERAIAWTDRRLVFDNEPLSKVFDEFNRYNRRALVLDAPALADRKITGVFAARDTETLLKFVQAQPGVAVVRSSKQVLVTASE